MFLILNSPKAPPKARNLMRAIYDGAKVKELHCKMSPNYQRCQTLILYGLGGADRHKVGLDHVKNGGRLVAFDLGYWDRKLPLNYRKYRVSIDGFHPQQFVMEGESPSPKRWNKSGLEIESAKDNDGPILLIGNAPKSIAIGARGWASQKSREIKTLFPDKKIIYRPKPKRPVEDGVICDEVSKDGDIDSVLRSASLVVCRHSNVSVDACRLGVPVVCDDGAAAAIYPQRLSEYKNQPDTLTREKFLKRLAYWQWSAHESIQFWEWFLKAFPAHGNR